MGNGNNGRFKVANNQLFEGDSTLLNENGMKVIRKNREVKIADSAFGIRQMQCIIGIAMKYPFIIVMVKKLNCCWMNKQPQQKQVLNIFSN